MGHYAKHRYDDHQTFPKQSNEGQVIEKSTNNYVEGLYNHPNTKAIIVLGKNSCNAYFPWGIGLVQVDKYAPIYSLLMLKQVFSVDMLNRLVPTYSYLGQFEISYRLGFSRH